MFKGYLNTNTRFSLVTLEIEVKKKKKNQLLRTLREQRKKKIFKCARCKVAQ